jgi:hypothetical protein
MIQAHSISTAKEIIASVDAIYMAQGPREKLAYRKGYEAGFNLAIEQWTKGESKGDATDVAEKVISMLASAIEGVR